MRRVGHIRERSPGSFDLRYSLGADASGKYKVATTTVRGSRKDAERELRRLLRAIDVGEHVGVTRMSVGQWFDRWLDMVRGESSSATHARYEMAVANYLRPAWGGLQLSKITPTHIQDTYAKWAKGGRRDGRAGPLAPSTRRLLHRVLMVALNRAVELQVIARNPATVLRRRLPKLERGEMRTLAPEQIHAVLDELSGKPQYTPIMLLLATGARRGEVLALRWRHLDLERGTALIVDSISPKLVIGPTKSGKPRTVTLPAGTVHELLRWRREQAEELLRLGVRQSNDTMICTWPDGDLITPESLSHFMKRLFKRLGLPVHLHSLRHTHATQLLLAGAHPKVVQERLGHATVAMTLDIYSHVTEKLHDDAAAKINDMLASVDDRLEPRHGSVGGICIRSSLPAGQGSVQ